VLIFGLGGFAMLGALVLVELRVSEPMIDVRLFKNRLFSAANSVQLVAFAGMQGALFLLPLLLQAERGLSPLQSGLTTFPQAIGVMIMVRPAGAIYRRIGPRRMMMIGMVGISLTTALFVLVDLQTSQWWIRLIMLGRGAAFAMTLIPMQTATFATIEPRDTGRASAIFNSGRQVAASFGVALLGTVLTNRLAHHGAELGNPQTAAPALSAFQEAFIAAAALSVVGFFAAFLIDDREAAATMQQPTAGAAPTGEREAVAVH
jgi:MFS family permease